MDVRFVERVSRVGTATGVVRHVDRVAVVFECFGETVALPMSAWAGPLIAPEGHGVRLALPMHGDWRCEDVEVYTYLGEMRVQRDTWQDEPGKGFQRLPERLSLAEAVARGLGVSRPRMGHFRFKERKAKEVHREG